MLSRVRRWTVQLGSVFHTAVIGVSIPIQLYTSNMGVVPLARVIVPAAIALLAASCLVAGGRIVTRDWSSRGIIVSLFLLSLRPLPALRHWSLAPLVVTEPGSAQTLVAAGYVGVAAVLVILGVTRMGQLARRATRDGLNVMAVVIVGMNVAAVVPYARTSVWREATHGLIEPMLTQAPERVTGESPDIFYIVLDGYARDDVLAGRYGMPDNPLTSYFESEGFYVARRSQANYLQTFLSIASSLNMVHLEALSDVMRADQNRQPLRSMIEDNAVVSILESLGYTTTLVSSDYYATQDMSQVDVCLCDTFHPSEFEFQWLSRTPLAFATQVMTAAYDAHRHKVLAGLDYLTLPPTGPGPHFVFAHLVAPHPPFVFGADGRPVTPDRDFGFHDGSHFGGDGDEYISGYRSQVAFINARLRDVVESIKARAGLEPVIIVQSDHGPGSGLNWESSAGTDMTERSGILSAYYLPGGGTELLYDSISPVNTFRVVFNAYFGGTYPMQPDRSSFSTWSAPYEFIDVTETAATR